MSASLFPTQKSNFEQDLLEQFQAVLFSEGEQRPVYTEGVNDYYCKEVGGISLRISRAGLYEDYLLGDSSTGPALLDGEPQGSNAVGLYQPAARRQEFSADLAAGTHRGQPARLVLRATVAAPLNRNPRQVSRPERNYSFYELNPDNFAPVNLGSFSVRVADLEGKIDPDKKIIVTESDGIVHPQRIVEAADDRDSGLELLEAALPVDIEKHEARRAQIAEEYGVNVRAYGVAA